MGLRRPEGRRACGHRPGRPPGWDSSAADAGSPSLEGGLATCAPLTLRLREHSGGMGGSRCSPRLHPSAWMPSQNHGARCSPSSLAACEQGCGQRVCRRGGASPRATEPPPSQAAPLPTRGPEKGPPPSPPRTEEKRDGTKFPKRTGPTQSSKGTWGLCEDVSQDQVGEGQPPPHLPSPRATPTAAVGPGSQPGGQMRPRPPIRQRRAGREA